MTTRNVNPPEKFTSDLSGADFRRIALAIRAAEKSRHRTRVGAVIVKAGRVASGLNRIRNQKTVSFLHQSTHAEMNALRRMGAKARGGTIYVARLGASGRLLPSHPCQRCVPVLEEAGVRRAVWWNGTKWVASKI